MAQKIFKLITDAQVMYHLDRLDIEILLAHALKKPREFIVANPDFFVPWTINFKFQRLIKKRSKGMPVVYLTGHKEFFGFDFIVTKDTLIPRPDTEILVEAALSIISSEQKEFIFIDIGTGSGCIPIAIYKTLQKHNSPLPSQFFATDISRKALAVAKKNAHKHFADVNFLQGNLLSPLIEKNISLKNKKIILTANLPYLTQEQFASEASIQHEPHLALVADDQGLALYKMLIEQIFQLQKQHIFSLVAFFEIDPSQSRSLREYIQNIFPNAKIEVKKDLAGFDRIIQWNI